VTPAQTLVSLIPSTSSAKAGISITFNVSLTSPSAGAPKSIGTVSYYDGSTLLGKATVNANGAATYSTSTLAVGTHTISASYSGGGNFSAGYVATSIAIVR
jgi:hypothetical protein